MSLCGSYLQPRRCSFLECKGLQSGGARLSTYRDDYRYKYPSKLRRYPEEETCNVFKETPTCAPQTSQCLQEGQTSDACAESCHTESSWPKLSVNKREEELTSQSQDTKKVRIYYTQMPTVPREPLPRDILEPRLTVMKATHWKGLKIPYEDPRFEPMLLSDRDTDYMTLTLDPFRYFSRRKKFPEKNRCPNLPPPKDAYFTPELLGDFSSTRATKMKDGRVAKKKFPRPPAFFRTRLW
ncbi:uncharacterized protein LOC131956136 [Physella acuta]|uniref:uncharacterized protein LOC131956136 n=1 Tax=Physella acuta TaxID=109671 RepID=UPI0027DC5243|nr:uncharacterized protein LOC131956136 [Physella acuta]